EAERLGFVEFPAQADVAVREREHRLRLREHVEIEVRLAHRPRLDRERRMRDHASNSDRSSTTMSAPCSRRAAAWPARSTPTTYPKPPARPALTPASASSNTAASAGAAASASAAARKVSGAGFPFRCSRSATTPSTSTSKRSPMRAACSTARVLALDETTPRRRPASRTACTYRTEPGYG